MPGDRLPAVRVGGAAGLEDGSRLTWVLAEGRRGRRWRTALLAPDGRMTRATLLEVGLDGRPTRLEVAGPDGLLTVHPGDDGRRLLGNVVRATGIDHVDLPWSVDHALLDGGSPVTAAVAVAIAARRDRVGVGEGCAIEVVEVTPGLVVRPGTWTADRLGERRWRLGGTATGGEVTVELDERGIPASLTGGAAWPLELDPSR